MASKGLLSKNGRVKRGRERWKGENQVNATKGSTRSVVDV